MRLMYSWVTLSLLAVVAGTVLADAPAAGGSAAGGDGAAPVVVYRPYRPGQTYDIDFAYERTVKCVGGVINREQEKVIDETLKYGVTGRVTDAKLEGEGKLRSFRLAVAHLTSDGHDSLRPGTVLEVAYDDRQVKISQVDGRKLPQNAEPILKRIFLDNDVMDPRLGAAVGSATPRKVGETWPIDVKATIDYLGNEDEVQAFNVTGTNTLKESPAGTTAKRLENTISAKNYNLPFALKSFMLESSDLTVSQRLLLPEDTTVPAREFVYSADAECVGSTPRGAIRVNVKIHWGSTRKIALVDGKAVAAGAPPKGGG